MELLGSLAGEKYELPCLRKGHARVRLRYPPGSTRLIGVPPGYDLQPSIIDRIDTTLSRLRQGLKQVEINLEWQFVGYRTHPRPQLDWHSILDLVGSLDAISFPGRMLFQIQPILNRENPFSGAKFALYTQPSTNKRKFTNHPN
jgi:hypothetical protein